MCSFRFSYLDTEMTLHCFTAKNEGGWYAQVGTAWYKMEKQSDWYVQLDATTYAKVIPIVKDGYCPPEAL